MVKKWKGWAVTKGGKLLLTSGMPYLFILEKEADRWCIGRQKPLPCEVILKPLSKGSGRARRR